MIPFIAIASISVFLGCSSDPATPDADWVRLVAVSPDSGLVDGVETEFEVSVEYKLEAAAVGDVSVVFNEKLPIIMQPPPGGLVPVSTGEGRLDFQLAVTPKDWGEGGTFVVGAFLLIEGSELIAAEFRSLSFADSSR